MCRKTVSVLIVSLSVLIFTAGCGNAYVSKGDKAYSDSKKAQGGQKQHLEKTAYLMYKRAMAANPGKIKPKTINRFLEMAINRVRMVLNAGTYNLDAIPLLIEEIDTYAKEQAPDSLKQKYADFLVVLADSSFSHGEILSGIEYLDKAIMVSPAPEMVKEQKTKVLNDFINTTYDVAEMEYKQGRKKNDVNALVRAEYNAKMIVHLDSTNKKGESLLSKIRKANKTNYSAFTSVIEDYKDTVLYDLINNQNILLAISTERWSRTAVTLEVSMYNYSFDALRLRAKNFFLVDAKGKKYSAKPGSKIYTEMLDQENETKLKLVFSRPKSKIKKLVYENEGHFAEKYFY